MKRFSLQIAAVVAVLGVTCLLTSARGQGKPASLPTRIALVDMSYVFLNYKKSDEVTNGVQKAFKVVEAQHKGLADEWNELKGELQSGTFDEESSEFEKRENRMIQIKSELETLKVQGKSKLQKKSADAALAVYQDVQQALERFATQNGYTLILTVNRDALAAKDALKIKDTLSQPIVYHHGAEDITDPVLALLNQEFEARAATRPAKAAPAATKPTTRTQAGAPKTKTTRRAPTQPE